MWLQGSGVVQLNLGIYMGTANIDIMKDEFLMPLMELMDYGSTITQDHTLLTSPCNGMEVVNGKNAFEI